MTDDQIIASAGEPVAHLNPYGGVIHQLKTGLDKQTHTIKLYLATSILSAVKPLRERIAELEAEVAWLKGADLAAPAVINANVELRTQLNTALAREKVLREAISDSLSDLKGGFVRCERCGDQEDTGTLDVVPILEQALALPHDDTALRQIVEDERERTHGVIAEIIDGCTVSKYATVNECRSARKMAEKIDAAIRARSNL